MHQPRYDLVVSPNRSRYEFVSVGPKGNIRKVVEYAHVSELSIWNLGFGDVDPMTGEISDDVITDNGDGRKVMTTVLMTLFTFFEEHPTDTVIFTGSDTRRTLIYNRIVARYYKDFLPYLTVTGLNQEGSEVSVETGMYYDVFIVRKGE